MNLGLAYTKRIEGEKQANIEEAIAFYRRALEVYAKDSFPPKWACIQMLLGAAYFSLIDGENRANMLEALACYRRALDVHVNELFPSSD
jgi:tetratricopeptide (TPR) repeat protein